MNEKEKNVHIAMELGGLKSKTNVICGFLYHMWFLAQILCIFYLVWSTHRGQQSRNEPWVVVHSGRKRVECR